MLEEQLSGSHPRPQNEQIPDRTCSFRHFPPISVRIFRLRLHLKSRSCQNLSPPVGSKVPPVLHRDRLSTQNPLGSAAEDVQSGASECSPERTPRPPSPRFPQSKAPRTPGSPSPRLPQPKVGGICLVQKCSGLPPASRVPPLRFPLYSSCALQAASSLPHSLKQRFICLGVSLDSF